MTFPIRRMWVDAVCQAAAGLTVLSPSTLLAQPQPNIIMIMADDWGWVDLSSGATNFDNGSQFYQTPNIDRIAAEGMSFTSAYAVQNCQPTRASLLTGQYAPRNGIHDVGDLNRGGNNAPTVLVPPTDGNQIATESVTVAETLQSAGYQTAHFGKVHVMSRNSDYQVGDPEFDFPTIHHGFDVNMRLRREHNGVHYLATQDPVDGHWEFASAYYDQYAAPYTQQYVDDVLKPFANGNNPDLLVGTPKHQTDAMGDAMIDFIQGNHNSGQPFFMNVSFNAVHRQIVPRADLQAKYAGITSGDPRHDYAAYAALAEGMDQAIGRIMARLDDPNGDGDNSDSIEDNTLVIVYSDNGGLVDDTDNSPLYGRKGTQHEGGLRVPMIARMPGTIAAGGASNETIHTVDFYPTFAEFAGAGLPDPGEHIVDGVSVASLLCGETDRTGRDAIFFHLPGYINTRSVPTSTIIRDFGDARIKLQYFYEEQPYGEAASNQLEDNIHANVKGAFLMFDLSPLTSGGEIIGQVDLGESNNLADGDMTDLEFKRAARATWYLRNWLDEQGAQYLTVRATGGQIPPPHHTPQIKLDFQNGFPAQGATAEVVANRVTLSMEAIGEDALIVTNLNGIGVDSSLDDGSGVNVERRIDGTLATPEALRLSFDHDVYLKSLLLGNFVNDSLVLQFVSGDNPFTDLSGYDSGGFSLDFDTLTYSGVSELVEFGLLDQPEFLLTAGTRIDLFADPAVGGGVLLDELSFAMPLEAVPIYLGDFNGSGDLDAGDVAELRLNLGDPSYDVDLDGDADRDDVSELVTVLAGTVLGDFDLSGTVDATDYQRWRWAFGSSTALAADGNSDGLVDTADYVLWRAHLGFTTLSASQDTAHVPEPAASCYVVAALAALLWQRRCPCHR